MIEWFFWMSAIGVGGFIGQLLMAFVTAVVTYYEYKWYVKPQREAARADLLKVLQSSGDVIPRDLSVN